MYLKSIITLALISTIASCSGCGSQPSGRMVDVGTHRLHMHRQGEGTPAVIIDVGIGGRSEEWLSLQERIAEVTTVCAYDRAGYGRSELGPFPRDAGRVADELHALLRAGSVQGPYLLVGHSLGGLNMQIFAARYPDDVVGMILLDPPPLGWIRGESYTGLLEMAEQMTAEWQALAGGDGDEAGFFRTIASEHREMLGKSADLAVAIETFGDTPMLVIASGRPNPMFGDVAQEYQEYWIEQSRILSGKSSRGEFLLAEDSSHRLHEDAADLVLDSALSMVSEIHGQ